MMKKSLLVPLVAALIVASVIGVSSCQKKATSAENAAKEDEWVPTTYMFLTCGDTLNMRDPSMNCPYCPYPVLYCAHGWRWGYYEPPCPTGAYDPVSNPMGHYHVHWFDPGENCTPPDAGPEWRCRYKEEPRRHRHVVVYWENGNLNWLHTGGGAGSTGL